MYSVSGHIDLSLRKFDGAYVDNVNNFVVGSCGQTVIMQGEPHLSVLRENGREDYQLIYISKGSYNFLIDGKDTVVKEGNIVVYKPGEKQRYYTNGEDDMEMYWAHFTGKDCENILKKYGFYDKKVFYVGGNEKFQSLYKWTIKELQLKRDGYIEIAAGYFLQILALMSRNYNSDTSNITETHLAERAMIHFYRHFSENISIDEYAASLSITPCWFRRCFKKHTGVSPQQFINEIRLSYARELLITSDYKIREISERVGYDNSFYFSRIFTKNTGCSPIEFRKNNTNKE